MNKDEPLRAGKVLSDFCQCGHLKNEHQTTDKLIECKHDFCSCELRFD